MKSDREARRGFWGRLGEGNSFWGIEERWGVLGRLGEGSRGDCGGFCRR